MFRIGSMTEDVRKLLREYLDVSGTTQQELADATHKHPMQISKALRGESGKLPSLWTAMFEAAGLKLLLVPADADVDALELIRQKALSVRDSSSKLREVPGDE